MIKIKIDCPYYDANANLGQFFESGNNTYEGCELFWCSDIKEADYWIVSDGLYKENIICNVNPDKVYFISSENMAQKGYYSDADKDTFFNQFSQIYSCHDMFRDHANFSLPFLYWHFYAFRDRDNGFCDVFPDIKYQQIAELNPEKTKTLSVFCSSLAADPYHLLRFRFVTALKKHFKDKLDWFGHGVNQVLIKADGILPYKYHLALENISDYNLISEKLYDSYLGLSYPLYSGATNVFDYFPENSLSQIHMADLKGSIRTIEQAIEENLYEKHLSEIKKSRDLVLNEYNAFKRIVKLVKDDVKQSNNSYLQNKKDITLNSMLGLGRKKKQDNSLNW